MVSGHEPLLNILCTRDAKALQMPSDMAGDKPVESVESVV